MVNNVVEFGNTIKALSRGPLGIITLFIVLVYGVAAIAAATGSAFTHGGEGVVSFFVVSVTRAIFILLFSTEAISTIAT